MLEGLLADDMLHPAGVLFRRFTVNTGSDELLCEELMAFIDYFRHFLAYVGQVEKSIHPEDVARLIQFRNDPSDESWIGGKN